MKMSCNGCRVLRKGCSEECMLRQSLQWIGIENPQAQGHATLFVAKFFGRATLMSFLSSVPANQRSAMFRSLMYEAVGRSINPVSGAVGLLWTGNWHLCEMEVQKVLRGDSFTFTPPFHAFQSNRSTSTLPNRSTLPASFQQQDQEEEEEEEDTSTLASAAGHSASQPKLLTFF